MEKMTIEQIYHKVPLMEDIQVSTRMEDENELEETPSEQTRKQLEEVICKNENFTKEQQRQLVAVLLEHKETISKSVRWVIYTDSQSSMLAIDNNRENHPILNQIYDILAELQNQGKQITICKVPTHIGVKGNEKADKAAK